LALRLFGMVVAVALLACSGCAIHVPLQRAQVDRLRPHDSAQAAKEKVGQSTLKLQHSFDHQGKPYVAQHFNLQTGTQQSSTVVCTPNCIFIPIFIPVYTPFVIIYDNGGQRVHAYGTIEELSKHPDEGVSGIMPSMKQSMQQALASKGK
jgi:hypothetical protein